jgi:virulence-associated protein VapD
MNISELKTYYGDPYNRAYFEIKVLLEKPRWRRFVVPQGAAAAQFITHHS